MFVCIVIYLILLILTIAERKGKIPIPCGRQEWIRILIILFLSDTIALGLFFTEFRESTSKKEVERNAYGKGSKKEAYEVTVGDQVVREPVTVEVEERMYTDKEIREIFAQIIEEMDTVILGENKSLDRVERDLNLVTVWEDYPVHIQWELDHYDVMNAYGEIQEEKTKEEGTLVEVRGVLSYGTERALYVTNVMVYPETKTGKEKIIDEVRQLFCEEEEKTRAQGRFSLPANIDGERIEWEKKRDLRGYYVLLLGVIGSGLVVALKKENEKVAEKERKKQMIADYPEIIYKFTLLLSTGMTVKNVWIKIVQNYEEQKTTTGERAAYEEMSYTYNEMQGGITEAEAYERFGKRCRVSVYMKFGALLSQNLRKGAKGITELLRAESIQAFENRKNRAKRLGEQAGTKLLMPMFGMLAIVLVIVVVPAFLSIQL